MKTFSKYLLITAASFILAACGGGGGGSVVSSTETFQIRTAYVSYINDSRSLPFTMTGVISSVNVSGSGTLSQASLTNGTFENQSALQKVSTITASLTGNNITVPLAYSSTSYFDSNYNLLGTNDGDEYTVVTGGVAVPQTAKVGDTAVWYTESRYTNSSKNVPLGTQVTSFALEPDTANTALLKIIQVERNTSGTITTNSTITFRITPAGQLTRISEESFNSGNTLAARY